MKKRLDHNYVVVSFIWQSYSSEIHSINMCVCVCVTLRLYSICQYVSIHYTH